MTSLKQHILSALLRRRDEIICDLPPLCTHTSRFDPRARLEGLAAELFSNSNAFWRFR